MICQLIQNLINYGISNELIAQADSNIPKTADETQMAAWMLAALLSLAGGSVLMRRKGEGTK